MYNFVRFVDWPDDGTLAPDSLLVIGILGQDRCGDAFDPVEGTLVKAKSKRLHIRRLGRYKDGLNLKACHVLFIGADERPNTRRILQEMGEAPVLTVGEVGGFLELGGAVNLVTVDEKIRWEIHQGHAEDAGLGLSSQLFRTAVRVVGTGGKTVDKQTR